MIRTYNVSLVSALLATSLLGLGSACTKKTTVRVAEITSRKDLIGGPGALGDVGDYLLANDKIRVVIQSGKYSRGFGFYGGALIDADLQRPDARGNGGGGDGYDNFSEMFPALFLKAMEPNVDGISAETHEDGSASVTVRGEAGDFMAMLNRINTFAVGDQRLVFFNEYRLRPGKSYVEITTTVVNQGSETLQFPGEALTGLANQDFPMPTGDVLLFGKGNSVFTPGAGFDLRYTLEEVYKDAPGLPQLPGLVTPFIATKGKHISYGFMNGITDEKLSYVKQAGYENADVDDLLIPFIFSAFTGAFYGAAPESLKPNDAFSFTKYFIIGSGDISSIRDVVHQIRKYKTGQFSGVVREKIGQQAEAGASVVTFDADGKPYNQHTADHNGRFTGTYEPGKYTYVVVAEARKPTEPQAFEIKAGKKTALEIYLPTPGYVSVSIKGEDGRALPGKCSLVGVHGLVNAELLPRQYLFDLKIGEHRRYTDMIPNGQDPKSREFIEKIIHAPNGTVTESVRPGDYEAVCSRGIEFELARKNISVEAGKHAQVSVTLKRAVKTDGWAGGDYHLHQVNSVDSDLAIADRVIQSASEGLDIAVATDHNYITDFRPEISKLNLQQWLQGMVGLEMTTLESGHFNSFPLKYQAGHVTKGSFSWHNNKPAEVFEKLRDLGAHGPDKTIVQVNHPRDTILGYYNQYNFNPDTGKAEESADLFLSLEGPAFGPENFNDDYDAIEVFNGKHFELLRHYRVPDPLPPPPLPMNIPAAGEIVRDEQGKIAYPGSMNDWFILLNQGKRYTGTGNSDSHTSDAEPGSPRTYVPVSDDRPGQIDEIEIVNALKNQQALATNGPFIQISVDGKGMGETVSAKGNKVDVSIRIQTPSWIDFDAVNFILNGNTIETLKGNRESLAAVDEQLNISKDSWLIVEVVGSQSMWPVYTGLEVPSLQIGDAVGGLAGSFGIDLSASGNLIPKEQSVTRAYAFTNPIFIDQDGDGKFTPPGLSVQALKANTSIRGQTPRHMVNRMPALMKMFRVFKCNH